MAKTKKSSRPTWEKKRNQDLRIDATPEEVVKVLMQGGLSLDPKLRTKETSSREQDCKTTGTRRATSS